MQALERRIRSSRPNWATWNPGVVKMQELKGSSVHHLCLFFTKNHKSACLSCQRSLAWKMHYIKQCLMCCWCLCLLRSITIYVVLLGSFQPFPLGNQCITRQSCEREEGHNSNMIEELGNSFFFSGSILLICLHFFPCFSCEPSCQQWLCIWYVTHLSRTLQVSEDF